jgi:3-isopropylmalate/(R)-2-methylmalate dehydratase large subunit
LPKTLFDKIWEAHEVAPGLIYIDLHMVHEVTSPQAFDGLRLAGRGVRRADRTLATADHNVPTDGSTTAQQIRDKLSRVQVETLERNCAEFGVPIYSIGSAHQGIVHVIGPELGDTQPGMTVACGDSHTATHGAFGAFAVGIGTSEVEHVLATQTLVQSRPKSMRILYRGELGYGVTAKDLILDTIGEIGVSGGVGHAIEYAGPPIERLSMEGRMTVCNMTIEAGGRSGMVAPDETTFAWFEEQQRPAAPPAGGELEAAIERWRVLASEEGASFDREVVIDAGALEPMITFGTNPGMGIPITAPVPDPSSIGDPLERASVTKALRYMDLPSGKPLLGHAVNVVFIGSCTISRISDLRAAAQVFKGRKVSPSVRVMVVPGSQQVKQQAQAEGLDQVFKEAGAEWREAGCSMCIAMNGDQLQRGEYSVSTSNRNFEGRQGQGGRTFLASPLTAAASAITGVVTDVRTLL